MKNYYFLGIGGVSMSSLAIMLKNQGYFVRGSDERQGCGTELLKESGICVDYEFNAEEIGRADVVVFSSAIKEDDIRFQYAKKCKKKILTRGELLGEVSGDYEKVIAVAGSHGKTTTTAMIANVLSVAGKEPTLHLGGYKLDDGKNFILGGNEYFVTEACEYHDNFLYLRPYISVVTNIEKEHMDYFKTFSNELKSFDKFRKNSQFVIEDFGDIEAKGVRHDKNGGLMFSLWGSGQKIMDLHMHICEEVNTQNCIYTYLVAKKLGIDECSIKLGLESFKGTATRFERKTCPYFDAVFCDYAHHPTEIDKAILTAKRIFKKRTLVTIFQPHTYSRTKSLFHEFLLVFKNVDIPLFYQTYSAREKPEEGMSSEEFCEKLKKNNKKSQYFDDFDSLFEFLMSLKDEKPVLLFLGAGDLPEILHKKHFTT